MFIDFLLAFHELCATIKNILTSLLTNQPLQVHINYCLLLTKFSCKQSRFKCLLISVSVSLHSTEFIQPQNLWPYIQQNLIQQNHLTNPAFITNNHHSHHLHPNSNNLAAHVNGLNNNNNNGSESNGLSCNNNNSSPEHHVDSRDNKVIAKPLPSRPFMHHGINHPHLHSLLAHCRNPYMTGKSSLHSKCN